MPSTSPIRRNAMRRCTFFTIIMTAALFISFTGLLNARPVEAQANSSQQAAIFTSVEVDLWSDMTSPACWWCTISSWIRDSPASFFEPAHPSTAVIPIIWLPGRATASSTIWLTPVRWKVIFRGLTLRRPRLKSNLNIMTGHRQSPW